MTNAAPNLIIDFIQARQNMVDGQVRTNKVTDHALIHRLRTVPREDFVPPELAALAYVDSTLLLPHGRFLLEPMVLARMLQSLALTVDDTVLDVGCASGYGALLMAPLVKKVVGIDSSQALIAQAQALMKTMAVANVSFHTQLPLSDGYRLLAPYDAILVNGALADLPHALFDQLRDGGRLIMIGQPNADTAATPGLLGQLGRVMMYRKSGAALAGSPLFDASVPYLLPPPAANRFRF